MCLYLHTQISIQQTLRNTCNSYSSVCYLYKVDTGNIEVSLSFVNLRILNLQKRILYKPFGFCCL